MKTCCIISQPIHTLPFGHNEEDERCIILKQALRASAERLITEHDVSHFMSNMDIGVPLYTAEILEDLGTAHPSVTLECVFPYETQAEKWPESFRDRYFDVASLCDKETLLQTQYTEGCVQVCEHYLIDRADIVLAVFDRDDALLQYASKKGKTVVLIKP